MAYGIGSEYLFGDPNEDEVNKKENFEELLEQYMNEDDIKEKILLENMEYNNEEKVNENIPSDLSYLKQYTITIKEFIRDYLDMDVSNINTKNLTHKNFKDLTLDNPFVVGIPNRYVDIDEIIKKDYILVTDCFGNIGSYLNPKHIMDLSKLKMLQKQMKIMSSMRITILSELDDMWHNFKTIAYELDYLDKKCCGYQQLLAKVGKGKVLSNVNKYNEHFKFNKNE